MRQGGYSTVGIRRRAVDAVRRGLPTTEVADNFGVDRITVYRWVKRCAQWGDAGLQRQPGSGRPRLFQQLDEASLRSMMLTPASVFGYETDLWTVRRVRQTLGERFGITLSDDTVWRRLREAGLTYQKPERVYFERDDAARAEWQRVTIPKIHAAVRDFRAILYFEDEANVSLTAFLGKTWARRGQTPQVRVTGARGGVAALSAISRRGGLLFRLYDRRIASAQVVEFLGQLLAHHPRRHLVVVMDQAPPHVSKLTRAYIATQKRLHVFHLPKYSPDWNPDEKVWNHLKHHELKAHNAKTKSELQDLTNRKLTSMASRPSLIRGLFFRCCVADFFG
jgi:transposase